MPGFPIPYGNAERMWLVDDNGFGQRLFSSSSSNNSNNPSKSLNRHGSIRPPSREGRRQNPPLEWCASSKSRRRGFKNFHSQILECVSSKQPRGTSVILNLLLEFQSGHLCFFWRRSNMAAGILNVKKTTRVPMTNVYISPVKRYGLQRRSLLYIMHMVVVVWRNACVQCNREVFCRPPSSSGLCFMTLRVTSNAKDMQLIWIVLFHGSRWRIVNLASTSSLPGCYSRLVPGVIVPTGTVATMEAHSLLEPCRVEVCCSSVVMYLIKATYCAWW
jgi:hypothetical protein